MDANSNNVNFSISTIKAEQFAIIEDNYSTKKEINLSTELQFRLSVETKQMAVNLEFNFIQNKKAFLLIKVSCIFRIEDDSWEQLSDEKEIVVPRGFLAHIAMITTGTTRGILFSKTEGTQFSKFIIPTMNVDSMVKDDLVFDLTS